MIDTTWVRRAPYSGTAIYIERVADALRMTGEVEVLEVVNTARRPSAGGGPGSFRNLLADLRWEAVEFPRLARRARAELIHHPLPAVSRPASHAQVLTVHDLSFQLLPGCYDGRFRSYARLVYPRVARRAGTVICVSETTAADVRDLWRVPDDRIVVAHHGPGQMIGSGPADGGGRSYFLYVGDEEPRKNLATLLDAYARYRQAARTPVPLVLAGSAEADLAGVMVEPRPSTQRLSELYAGALALIQPSLYEGFGLTALEAMQCGAPVLASRSPGLVEVCAGAALYAEPRAAESFATQMALLSQDHDLRDQLAARGRRRAEEFSWTASAKAHLEAYQLAIDSRRAGTRRHSLR